MEERNERISAFLAACDGLIQGPYTAANANISAVLKALVASKDLTGLFSAVTQEIDYPAMKKVYLREQGMRGAAYLPVDRVKALAFVFCLLAEIDSGKIRFEEFLLRYFYVDGSYTASYLLFSDRVLRPFRTIVQECFPAADMGEEDASRRAREERLSLLVGKIDEERARFASVALSKEDSQEAERFLTAARHAAEKGDVPTLHLALSGYSYFLRWSGLGSPLADEIFRLAGEVTA